MQTLYLVSVLVNKVWASSVSTKISLLWLHSTSLCKVMPSHCWRRDLSCHWRMSKEGEIWTTQRIESAISAADLAIASTSSNVGIAYYEDKDLIFERWSGVFVEGLDDDIVILYYIFSTTLFVATPGYIALVGILLSKDFSLFCCRPPITFYYVYLYILILLQYTYGKFSYLLSMLLYLLA